MLRAAAEIRICLISLYCGTLIGLMYDIFAFIRLPFNENRIIDAALDIMFYIFAGIAAAAALLYADSGRIRLYSIMLIAAGALIYCRYPMRMCGARIRQSLAKKTKIRAHLQNPCKNGKIRLEICAYMFYKYSIRDRCSPMRILPYKKGRYAA